MVDAESGRLGALPRQRSQLLPALLLAQAAFGYVSDEALERIAAHLRLTVNDVEGVATGYPDLRRRPIGEHLVRVCTGLSCQAAGSDRLLAALESALGTAAGQTTRDGQVTLEELACGFICAVAPVVEVDGIGRGRVTEEAVRMLAFPARPPRAGDGPVAEAFGGQPRPARESAAPAQALAALVDAARRRRARQPGRAARLLVGMGGCCRAVGAAEVAGALRRAVMDQGQPIDVVEAGCTGMCYDDVQVTLQVPGRADITWGRVEPDRAATLVAVATGQRPLTTLEGAFAWSAESVDRLPGRPEVPFLAGQQRTLLEHVGRGEPTDLDEALARGAYQGLAQALALAPNAVIEEVKRARLVGLGGACFPTGLKWEACRAADRPPRYLVVNAEEGEPGVFKDRHLLEGDPHLVLEGALIAAYAVGAERVFIYVNGLAGLARERLEAALAQARAGGLLGAAILDSAFSCSVEVREGGGGYVLGEESVLLESIEGRRPMPRVRPPHTAAIGLWDRPTVVNNVETLAYVPRIIERGADWFAGLGTPGFPGTKLISVSGDVARPGLVEVEIGATARSVLFDLAGGVPGGRALRAVLTGGPSGNLVPPDRLDAPLEPKRPDVLLGSGNLVALDDRRPLLEVVRRLTRFNAEESCGKCTPCREGVNRMHEILDRAARGQQRPSDREDLLELADIAAAASLCGLGRMAPGPVVSALHAFDLPGLSPAAEEAPDADRPHR